ncbi:glycogen synthase GlgA [Thermodesulfobacteriota bacterium]
MPTKTLKILFLASEVVPFAKSGGLADVAGSLPIALKKLGVDVRLVIPYYQAIKKKNIDTRLIIKGLEIPVETGKLKADIHKTALGKNIPVYLVEREDLYNRPNLYGIAGDDYYDNIERFSFFSRAALITAQRLKFKPDIIHCHDWQTGLVPALLKGPYLNVDHFLSASSVFTIHNLGYQGIFPANKMPVTGLPLDKFFHPEGLEYWGNISLLKSGIVFSDSITTVSPSYAKEILTPEYGMGMEGILKRRHEFMHGILNGVDYNSWNPAKDTHITCKYSPGKMAGKRRCKEELIKEMSLDPALNNRPLIGIISRLATQKGLDILIKIFKDIFKLDVGLVILGEGDSNLEKRIKVAAEKNKGKMGVFFGLNESLSHRIIAGTDMFLIPSRYEPCGLTQMYALKYGSVPIVRAIGGLNDTIVQFDKKTGKGNGFKFYNYDAKALLISIKEAVSMYDNSKIWNKLRLEGMKCDFSWNRSAEAYMKVYESVLKKPKVV